MQVLNQVLVLFFMIVIGFLARKARLIKDEGIEHFSAFVLNVSLPCLILTSLQKPFSRELLGEAGLMLALGFAMYFMAYLFARAYTTATRMPMAQRGVHEYAVTFSNVGFMGYPVIESVLGPDALFHLSIFNIPFNLIAYSIGIWVLSRGGKTPAKLTWRTFLTPAVVATLVGFTLFLFSVRYPTPLGLTFDMIGDITSPLSMLVIGAILARADLGFVFANWRNYLTTAMRLVAFPALFFLFLRLLGLKGLLLAVPCLTAAMPVAANTAMMATLYGADEKSGSSLVFISTLLCVATIPAVALLLQSFS